MSKLKALPYAIGPSPLHQAGPNMNRLPMPVSGGAYPRKRHIAFQTLSKKFEVVEPGGAFYIFPKAPEGISATDFVAKAIDKNVLVIPGNVFSERDTHFRISYATTDERLKQGCEILCSLV